MSPQDVEKLRAFGGDNAYMKAVLEQHGFKITYKPNGTIARVSAPRKPAVKHTAVTWARQRGYRSSMSLVRKMTKNKAVSLRKFKNAVERAALINDAKAFLAGNGYKIPDKFFNKVPTYVLKNNDFYENVNAILNSTAESDQPELDNGTINQSIVASIDRVKKMNVKVKGKKSSKILPKLKSVVSDIGAAAEDIGESLAVIE